MACDCRAAAEGQGLTCLHRCTCLCEQEHREHSTQDATGLRLLDEAGAGRLASDISMRVFIASCGGVKAKQKEQRVIKAATVTSAKRQATALFGVKGTWTRSSFTDIFDGTARRGWCKGGSGWEFGDHYIHMYEKE